MFVTIQPYAVFARQPCTLNGFRDRVKYKRKIASCFYLWEKLEKFLNAIKK
jgi:hypothetical protein